MASMTSNMKYNRLQRQPANQPAENNVIYLIGNVWQWRENAINGGGGGGAMLKAGVSESQLNNGES